MLVNGGTEILEWLYDLAVAPKNWPLVLHDLGRAANATGACIAADSGSKTLIARPVSPDLTDPIDDFINGGWYLNDLRGHRAWPAFKRGRHVLIEHDVSSEDERQKSAYHNEWLRPWDLPWWGAMSFPVDGYNAALVLLRNSKFGPLTQEEMRPFLTLRPHFSRVLQLTSLLTTQRGQAMVDALQFVKQPAFLLNTLGRVMRINASAEPLLQEILLLSKDRLAVADAADNKDLQRLITAIQTPHFPRNMAELRPAVIRRNGGKPLLARVLPVIGALSDVLQGARAILIVKDLGVRRVPSADLLRSAFQLTNAEANLAIRFAEDSDLSAAASSLGIAIGTARVHLKSIFAKTKTDRQSELVSLLRTVVDD